MCKILKNNSLVKLYVTIDSISINKKKESNSLFDTNNNVKIVKKKKFNNNKTSINKIIKQKIEEERE